MFNCEVDGEDCEWIPLCRFEAGDHTVKYFDEFEATPTLAAPDFIFPSVQEDGNPPCKWRIIHAKIMHLKNNWQTRDVAGETRAITIVTDPDFSLADVAICSDRIMAPIPNQPKHKYGIWNFNNVLGEPVQNIDGSLTEFSITHCHMNDEYMFVIQDLLLQVYRRDGDSYAYAFRGMYNKPSSRCGPGSIFRGPNESFQNAYLQLNRNINVDRGTKAKTCLVRHRFIALLAMEQSGKWTADIHVWALDRQRKLHVQAITSNNNSEFGLISSNTNDNVIIYYVMDRDGSKVFALDLNTFHNTLIMEIHKRLPDYVFEGNILATRERISPKFDLIKLFNANTSGPHDINKKTHVVRSRIVQGSVRIRKNYIGYCTDGQLNIKKIDDLLNVVFEYRYQEPRIREDKGIVYQFGEFDTILLVVPNELAKKIQLFNLTRGTLIKEIQQCDNIFPCVRSQHLFILQEDHDEEQGTSKLIKCIHFW